MVRIASTNGISSSGVVGNDRLMQFYHDGFYTTVHVSPDLETFGPYAIMQLIEFFQGRLSVQAFWPSVE